MQGQCSGCHEWNTLVEERVEQRKGASVAPILSKKTPRPLAEIEGKEDQRLVTPDAEFNRVLGGGIVPGSITLLGGEPGIGKSTLMLQLGLQLKGQAVLYVSGEESDKQIKMRADRLKYSNEDFLFLGETNLESILEAAGSVNPDLLVIDSIQTIATNVLESAPGSVAQVRECAAALMRFAKESGIPVFLIGHITKEGALAGPKVLEHTVDTVLTFEGEHHNTYRIVRTNKNRFGSTLELGIYEMSGTGLREVDNPSEIFLSSSDEDLGGIAVSATLEGQRPILIETQALVSPMAYGTPQRSATGFDLRRLNMLLAVLEKKSGIAISGKDVFVNLVGGIRIEDPALDLGLVTAIVSSMYDLAVPRRTAFAAEIGLSGELRPVSRIDQRLAEAEKLGFTEFWVADAQLKSIPAGDRKIAVKGAGRLDQVFRSVFGK